ncbi:Uncharacterised protein [Mycobacteroides abscessus subsp. abscessus]|uniref:Uncharacterized protein n=2 Tax=Mycobacteroides abscessus TaxID=36809 RepID=A0AB33T9R4_9MYCO|nr:hypothetical protein [Mycobacteroides abscessus]EUA48908.1 hypothetical protein I543_1048 [Mycobacteroides abscessus 21]MBE5494484.1 hypothetical protein [Mycobacteroides abscessus]MBN7551845.1 hypothetical protein [Mycobacteroides abscessus subsp. abscessus]MDM2170919.1 hypothetical protein [Mycobacteroides abscessus]MDM2176089.1 hypothetical protein [Mycobacteroides abscessus]
MAQYKTIECYKSKLEDETKYYGRDGWRRLSVEPHYENRDKILIEFVKD